MQVKLFYVNEPYVGKKGSFKEYFESQINQWLSENNGVEIVKIKQSASGAG